MQSLKRKWIPKGNDNIAIVFLTEKMCSLKISNAYEHVWKVRYSIVVKINYEQIFSYHMFVLYFLQKVGT